MIKAWIELYPIVSLLLFSVSIIVIYTCPSNVDIFEIFDKLESIKESSPKIYETLNYIVNESINGNRLPSLMLLLLLYFTPIVRWILAIQDILEILNNEK